MVAHAQILHWNEPERCVHTAGCFHDCPQVTTRVLDNGSEPKNLSELKKLLPPVIELTTLGVNLGWGAGHNKGLRRWLEHDATEVCFVSAHDAIPQGRCVQDLLDTMATRPEIGVLCPQFESPEIGVFSPIRGPRLKSVQPHPNGTIQDVDFAHGTVTVYRRRCLEQIGLFDEKYFAYGDEMELSLRARRAGWRVAQLWGAVVINPQTSASRPLVTYLCSRNSLLLARDYGGGWCCGMRIWLMLVNSLRMVFLLRGERSSTHYPKVRLRAVLSFLRGEFGEPPAGV